MVTYLGKDAEEVGRLDWTKMTRVLFHVADAPCRGSRFHCGANDSHPTGDPRGLDITNLLRKVTELNLNYFFAQMNDHTVKMIDEFNRELAELNGNKIEVVKYGAIEGFENTVATTISTSISRSKSTSFHDGGNIHQHSTREAFVLHLQLSQSILRAVLSENTSPKSRFLMILTTTLTNFIKLLLRIR